MDLSRLLGERVAQRPAGADVELAEDLAQVVLDGARADEELGADLRVGLPVASLSAPPAPSCGVSASRVSAVSLGAVSPVATELAAGRARRRLGRAPMWGRASRGRRAGTSRASTRRFSRRSHSPYVSRARASGTTPRVRDSLVDGFPVARFVRERVGHEPAGRRLGAECPVRPARGRARSANCSSAAAAVSGSPAGADGRPRSAR